MSFTAGTMCCACGGGVGCSKTETLEILDVDTNMWNAYDQSGTVSDNTADYPWINSVSWTAGAYGASIGEIKVKPTDTSMIPTGELSITYYLRWKVADLVSNEDEGTVYNEFQVTITDECHSNSLTLGNSLRGIEDFSYVMASSATTTTKTASVSQSNTHCPTPISMTCEVLLSPEDDWVPIDTCLDTDTVVDGNSNTCADYTADGTNTGDFVCGGADVTGFDANSQCC